MAIGTVPFVLVVLLMIVLRLPKGGNRLQHRSYAVAFRFQDPDIFFGDCLFFRIGIKEAGKILGADVGALSICLRKVMDFEKQLD